MATWADVAHEAFDKPDSEPIKADATTLAKFGAPSAAIVTAVLTALLGEAWNLDPTRPAVITAAAIVAAAVVLGVYIAFATDIRARGDVTRARYEALASLVAHETAGVGEALATAEKELAAARRERDDARAAAAALQRHEAVEAAVRVALGGNGSAS